MSLSLSSLPKGFRYAPPVHMIKLTETCEITAYKWVHWTRSGKEHCRARDEARQVHWRLQFAGAL